MFLILNTFLTLILSRIMFAIPTLLHAFFVMRPMNSYTEGVIYGEIILIL
jgi:hypothetical protein